MREREASELGGLSVPEYVLRDEAGDVCHVSMPYCTAQSPYQCGQGGEGGEGGWVREQ